MKILSCSLARGADVRGGDADPAVRCRTWSTTARRAVEALLAAGADPDAAARSGRRC